MTRIEPQPIAFAAPDITDDDIDAVTAVLRSGWLTTGDVCAQLESDLAARLEVPDVVAMSSCTAAIEAAYARLDLPPGSRVGVPTWTFVSSALAPHRAGAAPVLLDVDANTLNLSPASLAAALDAGLEAVVGVHFGGVPLDASVRELCRAAGVPLIEDAAHALGSVDDRGPIAGRGTAGACLSFYATKNLTSAEGGALATDDAELAHFARSYRLHGLSHDSWNRYQPGGRAEYDLEAAGIKGNLPDVLAALARSQLARFDDLQARRRAAVGLYRDALRDLPDVGCIPNSPDPRSSDHLFVIVLPAHVERARVVEVLDEARIKTSVHFRPLHRFAWFREHSTPGPTGVTVAESMADRVLSLPLHPAVGEVEVARVVDALRRALDG